MSLTLAYLPVMLSWQLSSKSCRQYPPHTYGMKDGLYICVVLNLACCCTFSCLVKMRDFVLVSSHNVFGHCCFFLCFLLPNAQPYLNWPTYIACALYFLCLGAQKWGTPQQDIYNQIQWVTPWWLIPQPCCYSITTASSTWEQSRRKSSISNHWQSSLSFMCYWHQSNQQTI